MPLIRVRAVKATNAAPSGSATFTPLRSASATMLLPSGVSSGIDESAAAAARSISDTPLTGRNSAA